MSCILTLNSDNFQINNPLERIGRGGWKYFLTYESCLELINSWWLEAMWLSARVLKWPLFFAINHSRELRVVTIEQLAEKWMCWILNMPCHSRICDSNAQKLNMQTVEKWLLVPWRLFRVGRVVAIIIVYIYISGGDRWRPVLYVDSTALAPNVSMARYTRVMVSALTFLLSRSTTS